MDLKSKQLKAEVERMMFPINWREAKVDKQILRLWDYFYNQGKEDGNTASMLKHMQ